MSIQLGIIGGGEMAEAILSRLLQQKLYPPDRILVSTPQAQRRDLLQQTYGVQVTGDNQEAANATEILLLAIKPQVLDQVAAGLAGNPQKPLVISVLAGIPIRHLDACFPEHPIVRAMPNTPAIVGAGITAIAVGKLVDAFHLSLAKSIFTAVGQVVEVPEALMDAVTGLSGSGPAYVAMMVEALSDGGVASGLPRAIARQLAVQTVLGTAQLIQQRELHPAELKDRVTSPGGTTIAGVAVLEKMNLRSALIEAVKSACRRSQELGKSKLP
ncbi:MAG: pyrroline-5-carboxylate reductase [Microcystaceae cyanobacterium]|nr:pyrroline-5-carboxylate reductase [Merismopediaceae bacterium]